MNTKAINLVFTLSKYYDISIKKRGNKKSYHNSFYTTLFYLNRSPTFPIAMLLAI